MEHAWWWHQPGLAQLSRSPGGIHVGSHSVQFESALLAQIWGYIQGPSPSGLELCLPQGMRGSPHGPLGNGLSTGFLLGSLISCTSELWGPQAPQVQPDWEPVLCDHLLAQLALDGWLVSHWLVLMSAVRSCRLLQPPKPIARAICLPGR